MADKHFQRNTFDDGLIARAIKDEAFRKRLLDDPRAVYAEELAKAKPGQTIPDGVEIRIAQEDENVFYLVLPCVPAWMGLDDAAAERIAKHEATHRNPCWGLGDAP